MSYTDLTSEFNYKDLLKFSSMDALAENDAFDVFLAGTVAFFYQASVPVGWTKIVTQNDKAVRVVAGAGGGVGGDLAMSTTFSFQHNHNVPGHTHTTPSHKHAWDITTQVTGETPGNFVFRGGSGYLFLFTAFGIGAVNFFRLQPDDTTEDGNNGLDNNSNFNTDNALATPTISFAYADVIMGSKDA